MVCRGDEFISFFKEHECEVLQILEKRTEVFIPGIIHTENWVSRGLCEE